MTEVARYHRGVVALTPNRIRAARFIAAGVDLF